MGEEITNLREQAETANKLRTLNVNLNSESRQTEQEPLKKQDFVSPPAVKSRKVSDHDVAGDELELMKVKLLEVKENSKLLQRKLAEKVIKLEETVDYLKETHEQALNAQELQFRDEVSTIKAGVLQREKQLLVQI
jgi:hypothetical protein